MGTSANAFWLESGRRVPFVAVQVSVRYLLFIPSVDLRIRSEAIQTVAAGFAKRRVPERRGSVH